MLKCDNLIAELSAILDQNGKDMGQAEVAATNDVIEMLERLGSDYEEMLSNAVNYANEHMMPVIGTAEPANGKITVDNFATVLFTTESAACDPSFDEALRKYPGIRAEDLQERLELDKQETMEYVETEMLPELKVRRMCTVRTYNTWNGHKTHIVSREDASMADLFGICRSSKDYEDYTIYCKDGQLRLMMRHHDATDHCVCMRIIDEDAYWQFCTQENLSGLNDADKLVETLMERRIAESLVPDIAHMLGIELDHGAHEDAARPDDGPDDANNPLRNMLRQEDRNLVQDHPNADPAVLGFITDMMSHAARTEDEYEVLRSTFRNGYCYYFAHMLKQAFGRGEVCWAAPFGHMVWVDADGTAYDVEGLYTDGEEAYLVPESCLGDSVKDFMRVPGMKISDTTPERIVEIIRKYEKDNGLKPADLSYYHIGEKAIPTD